MLAGELAKLRQQDPVFLFPKTGIECKRPGFTLGQCLSGKAVQRADSRPGRDTDDACSFWIDFVLDRVVIRAVEVYVVTLRQFFRGAV